MASVSSSLSDDLTGARHADSIDSPADDRPHQLDDIIFSDQSYGFGLKNYSRHVIFVFNAPEAIKLTVKKRILNFF